MIHLIDALRIVGFAALLASVPVAGYAQSAAADSYKPGRTPDGQPDLQGIWSNAVITPLERPADLADKEFLSEEEAIEYERRRQEETNMDRRSTDAAADVRNAYNDFWWDFGENIAVTRRTSLVIHPRDGRIPALTDEGQRRSDARAERRRLHPSDGPEDRTLADRCINWGSAGPPMMPTAYNNNFQLVQTADHVLILNEMIHDARIVPLDRRPHLQTDVRQWLGSSRGHWDGDTLVIETTNFTGQTNFRGASENMHLTERFTRVADDVLLYEFTVDDPDAFVESWTVQIPARKTEDLMYEYACHEGNQSMIGILGGARAEEQAAARSSD
ncbi:hypothetical protein [Candidatus Rariloculus sp.]|uniref:hypothetical protein n=1 Tax=Candidatus Rariloculus sp. TaxID=3101265 RepID=UPI003D13B946